MSRWEIHFDCMKSNQNGWAISLYLFFIFFVSTTDMHIGNEHTVLLCRTGEVYTAGYNDNGQCGQGTIQRVGALTRVSIAGGRKAAQVK